LRKAAIALSLALALAATRAEAQDTAPVGTGSRATYECPGCLAVVDAACKECPQCGIRFRPVAYQCPKCGAPVERDATQCLSCGVKFDPPSSDRERRTVPPRAMPEPRDFLFAPAPAKEDGPVFHGKSISLWRTYRAIGDGGGTAVVSQFVEDLWVDAAHLGIPELSFRASALAHADLGPKDARPSDEKALVFQLREALLRYEISDSSVVANLGRHFVNQGVARLFVDGGSAHVLVGERLGLEAFAGLPVESERASPAGSWAVGGRVYWRGLPPLGYRETPRVFRDLTIGWTFLDERWTGDPAKRLTGFDMSWSPSWWVDLAGHCTWDLLSHGQEIADARGALTLRPATGLQVVLEYRYIVPSDLLPKTDVFFSFANDRRHEAELRITYQPTVRLTLAGGVIGYYVFNDRFVTSATNVTVRLGPEQPYQLYGRVTWTHGGGSLTGEAGFEASLLEKGQNRTGADVAQASVAQARAWDRERLELGEKYAVLGSVELHLEAFDNDILRRNHAVGLTGSLGFEYDRFLTVTAGGSIRETPDFRATGEGFAKVEVSW
jgi:hypothetical protein